MSLQTVLRIWDCLFNEGSKILFRVALTLIKQHQDFILEASSVPDICDRFKQITKGDFVTECHTFMQASSGLLGLCKGSSSAPVPWLQSSGWLSTSLPLACSLGAAGQLRWPQKSL